MPNPILRSITVEFRANFWICKNAFAALVADVYISGNEKRNWMTVAGAGFVAI